MKKIMIMTNLLLLLVSCGSDSPNSSLPIGQTKNENLNTNNYTDKEIQLGNKLETGFSIWSDSIKNDQGVTGEKLEVFRAFHLGVLAKEILEIEDLEKLQIIFKSYKKNLVEKNENWNELSHKILK